MTLPTLFDTPVGLHLDQTFLLQTLRPLTTIQEQEVNQNDTAHLPD